jgi:hypothetical protein
MDNKRPFTSVNRRTKVNGISDTLLSNSQNESNEEIDQLKQNNKLNIATKDK